MSEKISLPFLSFPLNSLINTKVLAVAPESDKSRDSCQGNRYSIGQEQLGREGKAFFPFIHLMALPSVSPHSSSLPGSGSTSDTVLSRCPKGSRGQDPTDNSTLGGLQREGGCLAWQRAQAGAATSLTWAAACERRGDEGGTSALSHESSGVSWWQGALRKGVVLTQPQHLPLSRSTQEKAALWPRPRQ